MNKTEILNIVNEPSKHIQIVKIEGKDSIVYSSKFVELLELIPTMLTKDEVVGILDNIRAEIEKTKTTMNMFNREDTKQYAMAMEDVLKIINKYKAEIVTQGSGNKK